MTRSPLRLTLAATPRTSREQLRTVLPRQLWPALSPPGSGVQSSGPLLLSFHGTTFMDNCFAWLAGEGDLPPQRAWRDWCEPPLAMLARSGTAAYPATVRRGRPWGLRAESDPGFARGLASDGVPEGVPPWLRKLYLPQHDRFTVVVLELICQAADWPPLDRRRVKEAGLLVRRLRRSDPAGAEVWEDWIASDPRQGRWEVPSPAWEESGRDPAARPGLASQPLTLAPVTLAGVGKRCLLHGYLSLTSAEQEVPTAPPSVDSRAAAANALQERANAQLMTLAAGTATVWLPPANSLLELLQDTLLSAPPAVSAVAGARTALQTGLANNPTAQIAGVDPNSFPSNELLDQLLEQALLLLIDQGALDSTRFTADVGGNVVSGADLWGQGASSVVAKGRAALLNPGPAATSPVPSGLSIGGDADWDILVRDRLQQLLDAWISGQPLPIVPQPPPASAQLRLDRFREALLPALLAAALVRARGCRLAMAAAMNTAQGVPTAELDDPEAGSAPPLPRRQPRALHSLADLGEGLESFLATELERGTGGGLVPWGRYTPPPDGARLQRVDRNLRGLVDHYAPFESQLAEAGAEVRFELRERAEALETRLGAALNVLRQIIGQPPGNPGIPSLIELGVDLLEPPATGLLLLPGLGGGLANRLSDFATAVVSRYDPTGTNPQPVAEALVASQLRRPRFDAHHIYAVEAWVRVAPRRPGEVERLIWSPRSEPFVLAEPGDLLGSQPQVVPLPDVGRLLRDLGRLRKAGANPFLTLVPPPRSGAESRGGLDGLRRDWGLGTPVALVAPVLAVVGLGMLSGALRTVSRLPGFAWLRQVVVRSPAPERRP